MCVNNAQLLKNIIIVYIFVRSRKYPIHAYLIQVDWSNGYFCTSTLEGDLYQILSNNGQITYTLG